LGIEIGVSVLGVNLGNFFRITGMFGDLSLLFSRVYKKLSFEAVLRLAVVGLPCRTAVRGIRWAMEAGI